MGLPLFLFSFTVFILLLNLVLNITLINPPINGGGVLVKLIGVLNLNLNIFLFIIFCIFILGINYFFLSNKIENCNKILNGYIKYLIAQTNNK